MEMEGRNNSQAAASTHGDVAEGLALADKAMVIDAFNEIAWLYTQVNVGTNIFAPIFAYEEPEDLLAKATLDKTLVEIGVQFTAEHFQENYNLKSTEFTLAKVLTETQTSIPEALPEKSANFSSEIQETLPIKAQNILDEAIKELLPKALKANANFSTELENIIKTATSFDGLQLSLAKLLAPKIQPSALENLLGETMTAAAGLGAAAINEEIKADKD